MKSDTLLKVTKGEHLHIISVYNVLQHLYAYLMLSLLERKMCRESRKI